MNARIVKRKRERLVNYSCNWITKSMIVFLVMTSALISVSNISYAMKVMCLLLIMLFSFLILDAIDVSLLLREKRIKALEKTFQKKHDEIMKQKEIDKDKK